MIHLWKFLQSCGLCTLAMNMGTFKSETCSIFLYIDIPFVIINLTNCHQAQALAYLGNIIRVHQIRLM